jgi:hypothetical protein
MLKSSTHIQPSQIHITDSRHWASRLSVTNTPLTFIYSHTEEEIDIEIIINDI